MDRIQQGMRHLELTEQIIGACYDVGRELGAGFLESVYQKAIAIALREKGLKVEAEVPLEVTFRGQTVGEFYADLVVADTLIVELKATNALLADHQAQVINYLKATGYTVGLLVNFGKPRVEVRRLFWDPVPAR